MSFPKIKNNYYSKIYRICNIYDFFQNHDENLYLDFYIHVSFEIHFHYED